MVSSNCIFRCEALCKYEYCGSTGLRKYVIKFPDEEVARRYKANDGKLIKDRIKGYRYDVLSLNNTGEYQNVEDVPTGSYEEVIEIWE